jgi:AraC-like DNA-binding protein
VRGEMIPGVGPAVHRFDVHAPDRDVRRRLWIDAGDIRVEQHVDVRSREVMPEVTGAGWTCAVVEVTRGAVRYRRCAGVVTSALRFAVLQPPRTVMMVVLDHCRARTQAMASAVRPPEGFPSRPTLVPLRRPWRQPVSADALVDAFRASNEAVDIGSDVDASPHAVRIKALVDLSYTRPVRLQQLARQVGMTPASFSRAFKRVYGLAPVAYRHRLRLFDALLGLAAGGQVLDALAESGFHDVSQSYRRFADLLCAPPGAFRPSPAGGRRRRNAKT